MDHERQSGAPVGRRWLRVAAAADLLEVSQHTLRRWADTGLVPSRRTPSGQRQFQRSALERLLVERGGALRRAEGVRPHGNGDGDVATAILEVSRAVTRA